MYFLFWSLNFHCIVWAYEYNDTLTPNLAILVKKLFFMDLFIEQDFKTILELRRRVEKYIEKRKKFVEDSINTLTIDCQGSFFVEKI